MDPTVPTAKRSGAESSGENSAKKSKTKNSQLPKFCRDLIGARRSDGHFEKDLLQDARRPASRVRT